MIPLEIILTTGPEKQIELIQTINSLIGNMQQFCLDFNLKKSGNTLSLLADLKNEEQLKEVADSNELILLFGACRTLGIRSEIFINGTKISEQDLKP